MGDHTDPTWMDLVGQIEVQSDGTPLPKRSKVNVVGASVVDDPTNGRTVLTFTTEQLILSGSSGALSAGDVYCSANHPTDATVVTKATPEAIAIAGQALGIAIAAVSPGNSFVGATSGTVPASITGLGAGTTRPAYVNASARLARLEVPSGAEHMFGTSDQRGNVTITPRTALRTAPRHVYNVLSYGLVGDGTTYNDTAWTALVAAVEANRSSSAKSDRLLTIYFPPGYFLFASSINVPSGCHMRGASAPGDYLAANGGTFLLFDGSIGVSYDGRGVRCDHNRTGNTPSYILLEDFVVLGRLVNTRVSNSITNIVGDGTRVTLTFSQVHHLQAGDNIIVRGVQAPYAGLNSSASFSTQTVFDAPTTT